MNLTVHIGTTKTGSSSIQRFLHGNRRALRDKGILVPSGLGRVIHFHAVVAALPFGQSPDLAQVVKLADAQQHATFRETTRNSFLKEVAGARACHEAVITAEQLQSRLVLREHVQTFRSLFCNGFDKIRIIVYVRPQLDQLVSLYSTMLRGGYAHSLEDFVKARLAPNFRPYFDLCDVITRWSDVFGAENIIVRPYKGVTGELGTLSDFCNLLNIDPKADGMVIEPQANSSINVAGQELLLMLNQGKGMDPAQRRKVTKWAETHCAGQGTAPSLDLAREFQSAYDKSNGWVIRNFFPDHPEYLEPRWPKA